MTLVRAMRSLRRGHRPVRFGSLRSTRPLSGAWGYDRGTPVDRWYIDRFLGEHRADVTGRVLEVKDSGYTRRFGHDVTEEGVLDVDAANGRATYVADLADGEGLPSDAFDCFILTQTLQYVYDVPAALRQARRVLRPGGVLLATVPSASRVTDPPATDYWRFTPPGLARLLAEAFGPGATTVQARGNVLATVAFLEGLAAEDLERSELSDDDERLPLIVCARAVRGA
ncbi:MAG TPA: methyltransferase domain-containing protein [Solirubrobacteraceae bacterium]|nr:methyltransferase domain-containing protein [Solirubrobacteraceae bacterium]